jgi:hypothetical protein
VWFKTIKQKRAKSTKNSYGHLIHFFHTFTKSLTAYDIEAKQKAKISGMQVKIPELCAWCYLPTNEILISGGEVRG